ncbi:MAG: hypothetical protein ACRDM7_19545 [Thermoleophilaceae bacterium]
MTACRTCKAEITWAHTGEKWMPVDAQPTADGNVLLTGGNPPRAEVLAGERLVKARAAECRLYRSHFSSCPDAQKHRKAAA